MTVNGPSSTEMLRLFVERLERLEEDKKGIADDIKSVKAEAKGAGFDVPTIVYILKQRKMDVGARREQEALQDTYKAALGMLDGTPLGRWAIERLEKDQAEPEELPEPNAGADAGEDELISDDTVYAAAVALVVEHQKVSVSFLQRSLRIGYNNAAQLVGRMESEGVVSTPDASGRRTVLRAPATPAPAEPAAPPITVEDAKIMGRDAARDGKPVTSNPFPPRDLRRAAWDEAWCGELGSDGMDIPDALKPAPKAAKGSGSAGNGDAPGGGE